MTSSSLFDEKSFYQQFLIDLKKVDSEVIIESPYISSKRMQIIYPALKKLVEKNVLVYIFTRDPQEHSEYMELQSENEIQRLENLGVHVLICLGNHHRKLAILDRNILWEGSLNILSQSNSREIMRRIDDQQSANDMLHFLKLQKFL